MRVHLTGTRAALFALAIAGYGCGDPLADVNYTGPDVSRSSPDARDAGLDVHTPSSTVVKGSVRRKSLSATCGSSVTDDCKGALLVALSDKPVPPPSSTIFGSNTITDVDLSGDSAVAYEITGLSEGWYYLSALMSESGKISDPPYPSRGDLFVEPLHIWVKAGEVTLQDLVLDGRWEE
jgi:hypothetical protein